MSNAPTQNGARLEQQVRFSVILRHSEACFRLVSPHFELLRLTKLLVSSKTLHPLEIRPFNFGVEQVLKHVVRALLLDRQVIFMSVFVGISGCWSGRRQG